MINTMIDNIAVITSQIQLHSALKAIIEENKIINNYADDFNEADDIYGFVNDELAELNDVDVVDREIMETCLDDIPNAQPQPNSPPTNETNSTPTNESNLQSTRETTTTIRKFNKFFKQRVQCVAPSNNNDNNDSNYI